METQTIINVALMVALIGTFTYVGVEGQEPTHYCESRELTAYCYSFSPSTITCYTLPGKIGGKRCTENWKEIDFQEVINTNNAIKEYSCDNKECKEK